MSAGNRETSVNFMVNGINLNDLSNIQVTFQPSINTVSEFKVDNSTFSAEYGRNSGAIVNVATRSGSNQLHGEGFDFYRDTSSTRATTSTRRADTPATSRRFQPQAVRRQPRRTDREEPLVLLRQLRRPAPHAGRRPELRDADRRAARGRHRSGGEEPAASTSRVANDLDRHARHRLGRSRRSPSTSTRSTRATTCGRTTTCTSTTRSRRTSASSRTRRATPCRASATRAAAHRQMHDGQRDARLQPGARQRSARRLQPHQHHLRSADARSTPARSASTSARRTMPIALPQITIIRPGPELRRPGRTSRAAAR